MTESLSFKVPRELGAVRQAAARLRELLNASNLPEESMGACELALAEACNNAIQHGRGQIDLCVDVCLMEGRLEMRVWDSGPGFELPAEPRLPENDAERGRGLFLIHSLMDTVAVETLGGLHCLAMCRQLPPEVKGKSQ